MGLAKASLALSAPPFPSPLSLLLLPLLLSIFCSPLHHYLLFLSSSPVVPAAACPPSPPLLLQFLLLLFLFFVFLFIPKSVQSELEGPINAWCCGSKPPPQLEKSRDMVDDKVAVDVCNMPLTGWYRCWEGHAVYRGLNLLGGETGSLSTQWRACDLGVPKK